MHSYIAVTLGETHAEAAFKGAAPGQEDGIPKHRWGKALGSPAGDTAFRPKVDIPAASSPTLPKLSSPAKQPGGMYLHVDTPEDSNAHRPSFASEMAAKRSSNPVQGPKRVQSLPALPKPVSADATAGRANVANNSISPFAEIRE